MAELIAKTPIGSIAKSPKLKPGLNLQQPCNGSNLIASILNNWSDPKNFLKNLMHSALQSDLTTLPPIVAVRPMLMLTGFLGAGKTTLLRSLLDDLTNRGHLADVILNDRENAHLDQQTLQDHAASVAALTGSCVCCEDSSEFYDLILKASKSPHRVLLIELNGTADPVPLQETFTLLESKFSLRPRWQVCVIDARHFGKRERFNDLENLQLETASHYYLSWSSQLSGKEELELEQRVKAINPRASRATASTLADSLSQAIHQNQRHSLASRTASTGRQTSPKFAVTLPPEPKLHERHQLAHEFTGCNLIFPKAVAPSRVTTWLKRLPDSVIRAKALVTLTTDPDCRFLYERVGSVVSPSPLTVRTISKIPCSGLFIGADLDPEEILRLTREHLHPDCHFPEP